ncbi:MAG: transposase [Pseudomonadales bacterium]|nr:transposase [Pseudomonadales bacterium]
MARMARLYLPGCSHHVIQRGNNRAPCFTQESDYRRYLEYLSAAAIHVGVAIHSFVLMTNHVHLLLTPKSAGDCGKMMQSLGRRYVRYFNDCYGRSGTLWEGRYKSTLIDSDNYFFTVSKYIELNPVRAKMVRHPGDYPWSSFHSNALGVPCDLLTPHDLYLGLGHCALERQHNYKALFESETAVEILDELRRATNRAWAFGSEEFKFRISSGVNRRPVSMGWGGDRRSQRKLGDERDQGV